MKTSFARLFAACLVLCAASGVATAQRVDKVTAGGFITGTPSGARANFGVNARATLVGHLNYVDHAVGAGLHVLSTAITTYTIVNATTRTITGTCTINGVAGTFTATLVDNGEPGTADTFSISLSTGYAASGTLVGGNVQLHAAP